jgi:hypothetical protein
LNYQSLEVLLVEQPKNAVVACGLPYSNTRAEGNTRKQLISLDVVLPGEQPVGARGN